MQQHSYSLHNIKSQAKKIKRQQGIRYTAALELIAIRLGYANWKHCQRALSKQPPIKKAAPVPGLPINFNDWLRRHKNRDSPLGDLSKDMIKDNHWPLYETLGEYQAYLLSLHLRRGASAALENAWKSYQSYLRRKKVPKAETSSIRSALKGDLDNRKVVFVKNIKPIHINFRTVEEFNPGALGWTSWDGRKAYPVTILEVDERYYTFTVDRPLKMKGNEYYLRKDEVRSTPELACANRVTG